MAVNPRLVIKTPLVWYAPAATPTVFASIEGFVKKITIKGKRNKVDVKGYASNGNQNQKTDPNHDVDLDFFHSRNWGDFSDLMVTEFNADDPTIFRVKYRGATAAGVNNRVFQFAVQFSDLGSLGGEQSTASMLTVTLPIEGVVQSSIDGAAFTDYF